MHQDSKKAAAVSNAKTARCAANSGKQRDDLLLQVRNRERRDPLLTGSVVLTTVKQRLVLMFQARSRVTLRRPLFGLVTARKRRAKRLLTY